MATAFFSMPFSKGDQSSFISADRAILRLHSPALGLYQLSIPVSYPGPLGPLSAFLFTRLRTKEVSATDPGCHAKQPTVGPCELTDVLLADMSVVNRDASWIL